MSGPDQVHKKKKKKPRALSNLFQYRTKIASRHLSRIDDVKIANQADGNFQHSKSRTWELPEFLVQRHVCLLTQQNYIVRKNLRFSELPRIAETQNLMP